MMKPLSALLLFLLLCTACSHSDEKRPGAATPQEAAVGIYEALAQGNCEAYVNMMLSCDSAPQFYRDRMLTLVRQNAAHMEKEFGGIETVSVAEGKVRLNDGAAEVGLILKFKNGQSEEISVSLICDNGRWRLR